MTYLWSGADDMFDPMLENICVARVVSHSPGLDENLRVKEIVHMVISEHCDYIVAGAGAGGIGTAYELA